MAATAPIETQLLFFFPLFFGARGDMSCGFLLKHLLILSQAAFFHLVVLPSVVIPKHFLSLQCYFHPDPLQQQLIFKATVLCQWALVIRRRNLHLVETSNLKAKKMTASRKKKRREKNPIWNNNSCSLSLLGGQPSVGWQFICISQVSRSLQAPE